MIITTESEYLNPPAIAKLLGVSQDKTLVFIHSGEQRASDVSAVVPGGVFIGAIWNRFFPAVPRPPPPKRTRRHRRQTTEVIEFYR